MNGTGLPTFNLHLTKQDAIQKRRIYTWKKNINGDLVDTLPLVVEKITSPPQEIHYRMVKRKK